MRLEETVETVYAPQHATLEYATGMAFYSGPEQPPPGGGNPFGSAFSPPGASMRSASGPAPDRYRFEPTPPPMAPAPLIGSGPAPIGTHTDFQRGSLGNIRQGYDLGNLTGDTRLHGYTLQERYDFGPRSGGGELNLDVTGTPGKSRSMLDPHSIPFWKK